MQAQADYECSNTLEALSDRCALIISSMSAGSLVIKSESMSAASTPRTLFLTAVHVLYVAEEPASALLPRRHCYGGAARRRVHTPTFAEIGTCQVRNTCCTCHDLEALPIHTTVASSLGGDDDRHRLRTIEPKITILISCEQFRQQVRHHPREPPSLRRALRILNEGIGVRACVVILLPLQVD